MLQVEDALRQAKEDIDKTLELRNEPIGKSGIAIRFVKQYDVADDCTIKARDVCLIKGHEWSGEDKGVFTCLRCGVTMLNPHPIGPR